MNYYKEKGGFVYNLMQSSKNSVFISKFLPRSAVLIMHYFYDLSSRMLIPNLWHAKFSIAVGKNAANVALHMPFSWVRSIQVIFGMPGKLSRWLKYVLKLHVLELKALNGVAFTAEYSKCKEHVSYSVGNRNMCFDAKESVMKI